MSHLALKGFSQTCQTSSQRMSTVTSNRHSQLKNNQGRPSICCNRKAAQWSSHKCRLVLASNNLLPLRTETKCHLFGIILAARISHRSRSSQLSQASTRLKDAALGQMCQELQFLVLFSTPSLHQRWYWHNKNVSSSHLL